MANAINKTETINSGLEKGCGENGFTLIEAIIAIFILTIALLLIALPLTNAQTKSDASKYVVTLQ
jgi:prepilin-type N-terminal cleavage/methylation domain-containing protein